MLLPLGTWVELRDGDHDAFRLFERHYSFYRYADNRRDDVGNRNRRLFVGPGEKMVLMTPDGKALFVWRKFKNDCAEGHGINCAVFRNEGPQLSSGLVREAEVLAWERWPGERLYTFVNPREVRSTNPGCCFKVTGWRVCGVTKKRRLLILEKLP